MKCINNFLCTLAIINSTNIKKYRNVLNRAIEGAKRNYCNKVVIAEKHNSEKLYQIINKICKLKNSKRIFPTNLLNDKGNATTKPEEIACVLTSTLQVLGTKWHKIFLHLLHI